LREQLQVRRGILTLTAVTGATNWDPVSRHCLDVAVQVAGIAVALELAHQIVEAVVPHRRVVHPTRIRTSFDSTTFARRASRCRTSYSYCDNPTGSLPRVSDLLRESSS
jgi:hypothetical protein